MGQSIRRLLIIRRALCPDLTRTTTFLIRIRPCQSALWEFNCSSNQSMPMDESGNH